MVTVINDHDQDVSIAIKVHVLQTILYVQCSTAFDYFQEMTVSQP